MEYGRIVKEAFKIAWEHKSLWIFGLFAGGSAGFNFDPSTFGGNSSEAPWGMRTGLEGFPDINLFIPLIIFGLVLGLVFLIANLVCTPALVDAVNKIKRGGIYAFGSSFSAGVDFLGRFLVFFLIAFALAMVFFGILFVIGFIAFKLNTVLGVISLLFLIPILIAGASLGYVLASLTERAMVIRNVGISDAFDEAILLVRRFPGPNAIMLLIIIAVSIGLSMATGILFLMFGLPLTAIGMLSGMSFVPALILTAVVSLPISLVVGGFMGAAIFNMYTLFYIELVEPSQPTQVAPAASL